MTITVQQAEALAREGIDALRAGDGRTARDRFERTRECPGFPVPWLMLAQASRLLRDEDGEARALDAYLSAEPRNLVALLMMGALKARIGDDRAATSNYRTAMAVAAAGTPPPALAPMLREAEAFLARASARFEDHLQQTMDSAGIGTSVPRIAQAMDLLLGRTQLHLQQPTSFYFPGLPQRQFYERDQFDWVAEMEAAAPALRDELRDTLSARPDFDPYVVETPGRPRPANHLLNDPSWGAHYFWQGGEIVAAHAERAPATMAALAAVPMPVIARRSPMALYSLLRPGTHIAPHHGLLNTRLICHLPLLAPEGCALRVGSETRPWRFGEMLIFDDSIEHEAWNRSGDTRVVLLFEIWRPEITTEERAALTIMFEAIDDYQGVPQDAG